MDNDNARAIAALEPFANMICLIDANDPYRGSAFDRWHPAHVVFDIGSDRKITVGDLRRARTTLASLRAVAPAPADPSEIDGWRTSLNHAEDARDAVVADKNELFGLLEGLYFRIMGRDGIFEPKKAIDEIIDRWDYVGHALKLADDNAARNAPADQSDAGRDGAIEECAMVAERQYISSISFDANPYRDVAAAIRALASAPSETVGRGEDDG